MYLYLVKYLIIIFLFILVKLFSSSNNKKIRALSFLIAVFTIMAIAYLQLGPTIVFNPFFIVLYIVIIFGIYLFIYNKNRNLKYQKESYDDIDYLNRDVSTEYPPSIVGYLINQKLRYKDLIADIMELYAEKIINISRSNSENGEKIHFYLQDADYRNKVKSQSQTYIINTLINDNENIKFDFRTWKRFVLDEYDSRKFSRENDNYYNPIILIIIILCIVIIGGIIGYISGSKSGYGFMTMIVGMLGGGFIGALVGYEYINFIKNSRNTDVFLSAYGKSELKKWIKFKNFIKEYTLLKDRTVEEITIYESYIPYAIVLDVNVLYKNTKFEIFNDSEFQSIINESDCANFLESMGIDV